MSQLCVAKRVVGIFLYLRQKYLKIIKHQNLHNYWRFFFGGVTFNGRTITKKSCKYFDLQDSVEEIERFYITLPASVTYWYSSAVFKHFRLFCTLFPTSLLKSLRRLWHYDTRFLLFNKSVAVVLCLSSHYLCIMFTNCHYEGG